MTILIAILNLILSIARLSICIKNNRLMSVIWFLIAYFSLFFLPVSFEDSISHYRSFRGDIVTINSKEIARTIWYVFIFNLIFMISEWGLWTLTKSRHIKKQWDLNTKDNYLQRLQICFGLMLIFGSILYGVTTKDHAYKDFIEYKGSNWGQIFFMASAPLLTISAFRKQYTLAFIGAIPFIYFAIHLHVRSFVLLSFIPIVIIYVLQAFVDKKRGFLKKIRKLLFSAILILSLIGLSAWIISSKRGADEFDLLSAFPDSGMPYGTTIIMKLTDKYSVNTGFDSLALYGSHLLTPFRKLLQIPAPSIVDPPFVMSTIFDGIPKWWKNNLHYPTLWYADAYLSFGKLGLFLAFFWAIILVFWERMITKNVFLCALLLPYFTWHAYMLVRGAISGAVVPFQYSVYFVFIVAIVFGYSKFLRQIRG